MSGSSRLSLLSALLIMILAGTTYGQVRKDAPSKSKGGPPGFGFMPTPPPPKPLIPDAAPLRTCESLADVSLPNTTIESAAVDPNNPGLCRVAAYTTHTPTGDRVRIWIGIPTSDWNGRFMGTGGGGFSGGSERGISQPVAQGYAAGATDTGHEGMSGSFALDADGRLDWQLIRDNAHVGIHEMTVVGKALTEAMYGTEPRYSYFNGCSTGGRQGLMEAQRYPRDYDGIMSGAPAINWNRFHVQHLWGPVLMKEMENPVAGCKLTAATGAVINACDSIDGVKDGVIEDPERCDYDPAQLIGTSVADCGTFTEADATVIRKLWQGPRSQAGDFLWYGLPRGTDMNAIWGSRGDPPQPQAFGIAMEWFRYFLAQDPLLDWITITRDRYERFWEQSVEQYGDVIGTDNPDLKEFRDRGGKAIVWHGWSDPLISAEGTVDYYIRVQQEMGGPEKASQFIRLFMAPGVSHCGGGTGPSPSGQMEALLAWVEEGKPPETLDAALRERDGTITRSRPLCPYPLVAKYRGSGSTDDAANFVCSEEF